MTKDWSFTAWAENGPIEVIIENKTSDEWPFVERDDSLLPPDEFEIEDVETNNAIADAQATIAETSATTAA